MGVFLLSSSLGDAIEKMMNSYWWEHSSSQAKGVHWLSWDKLYMPKQFGGIGFKNLNAFNLDMFCPRLKFYYQAS